MANAVYDGTSAIMLSGETAIGKYPIQSLSMMSRIAETTERNIRYQNRFKNMLPEFSTSITSAISQATCSTAHSLGAKRDHRVYRIGPDGTYGVEPFGRRYRSSRVLRRRRR